MARNALKIIESAFLMISIPMVIGNVQQPLRKGPRALAPPLKYLATRDCRPPWKDCGSSFLRGITVNFKSQIFHRFFARETQFLPCSCCVADLAMYRPKT